MHVFKKLKHKNINFDSNSRTMKQLFRPCPICDSLNGEVLHKQLFLLPSNSILPNEYRPKGQSMAFRTIH